MAIESVAQEFEATCSRKVVLSMDIKAARRSSERTNVSVLKRIGGANQVNNYTVCKYWLAGRCIRNPCRFLHSDSASPQPKPSCQDDHRFHQSKLSWKNVNYHGSKKTLTGGKIYQVTIQKVHKSEVVGGENTNILQTQQKHMKSGAAGDENENFEHTQQKLLKSEVTGSGNKNIRKTIQKVHKSEVVGGENTNILQTQQKHMKSGAAGDENENFEHTQQKLLKSEVTGSGNKNIRKTHQKLCKYWVTGSCVHRDECENLHSWFTGDGFSLLARLEGHTKAVTGIALPCGSDKLYSGGKDNSVRVWDCNTGKCATVVDLKAECGALISEGPLVFVGLPNTVKAWDLQSQVEHNLQGPLEQVHAIAVFNELLFAGSEDGTILVWKSTSESSSTELVTSLKGHSRAVLSLVVGVNRLYSGSADRTIRVWDLESLKCMQTLIGHTNDVTSVICWENFLLSGSLDSNLKVWSANERGNLESIHERVEDDGITSLCGITDAEAKPILLCSCKDNTVRLYDLPSFSERGRIFAKREVQVLQIGTGGLFFTGDATGLISVWKLHGEPR